MRALLLVCLLGAAAHADVQGTYAIGVTAEYGTTYLPPTAGASGSMTLSYREWAGVLGNAILFIGEAPAKPVPTSRTTIEKECSASGSCAVYEVTRTTYPSQAEVEAWEKEAEEWGRTKGAAIMRGEMGQLLHIDVTARGLGGDASGFKLQLFRPLGGGLSIGQYAMGWLTYHDITTKKVVAEGGVVRTMDVVSDHTWKYVGMPLRLQVPFGSSGGGMHLQFDNNILSLFFDEQSPIRLGGEWVFPHVIVGVQGVISGLRPDGYSISGTVTLAM